MNMMMKVIASDKWPEFKSVSGSRTGGQRESGSGCRTGSSPVSICKSRCNNLSYSGSNTCSYRYSYCLSEFNCG